MSYERAVRRLQAKPVDRIPLFDCPAHYRYLERLNGYDPNGKLENACVEAIKKLDIDIVAFDIPPNITVDENADNMYGLFTTEWRSCGKYRTDIFDYDPQIDRHNWEDKPLDTIVDTCRRFLDRIEVLTGKSSPRLGYTFTTCFHYAAEDLDYETFLMACLEEEDRISDLLDKFEKTSEKYMAAWAESDIDIMLCHDDIANAHGLSIGGDWIRRNLIPRYQRLFKPFKQRNIPLLFMTDGNFLQIAPDLVEAGADGFFLDNPAITLEEILEVCPKDLIYFTGPSPAVMNCGTPDDVRREVYDIADKAKDCPRFFFHMPGGFTYNTPAENVEAYFSAVLETSPPV